jgi:hypothetical protein
MKVQALLSSLKVFFLVIYYQLLPFDVFENLAELSYPGSSICIFHINFNSNSHSQFLILFISLNYCNHFYPNSVNKFLVTSSLKISFQTVSCCVFT